MKFDDLDSRMRVFETAHDHRVLPGMFIVARIDGRSFTRLTRETHAFDAPYDVRVRDMMVSTLTHVMSSGFQAVYGYTQSDEMSVLFHRDEGAFGRKLRKLESVLAGEASAKFSLLLGDVGAFDCRISQLPRERDVVDYFRWRHEDAHRNALHGHCYWMLRGQGLSDRDATTKLEGKSVAFRNELLFQNGINFNEIATWMKRGVGVRSTEFDHVGHNPKTGQSVTTTRRRLAPDYELPLREAYSQFLVERVREAGGYAEVPDDEDIG